MLRRAILAALFFAAFSSLRAQMNPVLQDGEQLVYKVKYGFIRLGTVVVTTQRDATPDDPDRFKLVLKLDSSPSVPFANIHEYNASLVDAASMMSKSFYGLHLRSGKKIETQFNYDAAAKKIYFMKKDHDTGDTLDMHTVNDAPPYLEGPSLFFYGRWQSHSHQVMHVPTLVDGAMQSTTLDFTKGRAYLDIDGVGDHILTRRYEGVTASGASSAGMDGGFTVWVTDDSAAVPVRAEMKILVGSITLELEKYTRPGWTPPS